MASERHPQSTPCYGLAQAQETHQRLVAKAITSRAGDVKTYISPQQNTELPAERFKFDERVDSFNNLQILEKAARQVYQGQTVSTS